MHNLEAADDPQVLAVYDAEAYAMNACKGKALPKVSDVENYLASVFKSRWFKAQFPRAYGFEVLDGRGANFGWGKLVDGICRISLPRALRCELILLHELSHAVAPPTMGRSFVAATSSSYGDSSVPQRPECCNLIYWPPG